MSFRQYFRMILPEGVLGTAASSALSFCILDGFDWTAPRTESTVPVILVCLFITFLGLLLSWSRRSMAAGAVLAAAAAAGSAVLLYASGAGEGPLFYVIIVLTAMAFFLLSRTRIGAAISFAGGMLVICGSAFLQFGNRPGCLIVYLIAAACLLVLRNYRVGMLRASTSHPQMMRVGALALAVCLISAGAASGLYAAVLKPLDLPTQQLKLVTELRKLPLLEKMGVASTIHLMSREEESGVSRDQKMTSGTPQETEEPDQRDSGEKEEETKQNASGTQKENADGVRYHFRNYWWLYLAAAVLAVLIAAVLLKRFRRTRRRARLLEMPRVQQVVEMYGYFLLMMQRCGLPPVGGDTPLEYSRRVRRRGEGFFLKRGEFLRAAQIFERACYGGMEPSPEEYEFYWNTYLDFPKRCMKNGNWMQRIRIFFLS